MTARDRTCYGEDSRTSGFPTESLKKTHGTESLKKTHGGARPGAGMPLGFKTQKTIAKEAAREALRQMVLTHMERLVAAQVAHAEGLKYLVTRDKKTGKFIRVGEAMAKAKQGDTEETIEVWEKDPSVQAFTDLMNRAIDKPAEQLQEVQHTGSLTLKWQS